MFIVLAPVFFFYPLDFTFVCPTEILAFKDRVTEFKAINAEVRYFVCCKFTVNSVIVFFFRVVDRHRPDADPVLIPISILMTKSGSKSDPKPDWHQHDASNADPIPSFRHVGIYREQKIKKYFIHNNSSLQCFSFLISGKGVMILSILYSILKLYGEMKKYVCLELILFRLTRFGPACPGCRFGSDKMMRIRANPIRIHNTVNFNGLC